MKILFDHQIFTMQNFGGISKYIVELSKSNLYQANFADFFSNNANLKKNHFFDSFADNKYINYFIRKLIWNYNEKKSIQAIKKNDFDIFHPTYFNNYFLKYLKNKPVVLTVYDTIYELFPQYFNKNDKTATNRKNLIYKADRIIAISENTKKDIIKFYNIDANKIDVIYLGYDIPIIQEKKTILDLPQQYILYTGNRKNYKNFNFFIKSIAEILLSHPSLYLVCTGYQFNFIELQLIKQLNLKEKVIHCFFTDETMHYLYKNATVFVYPSLYEGFGIPILDAFNAGCPTILTNASCFPEIAQNGALYFEPNNALMLREKIQILLNNKVERENLILKATERLKYFSWEKTRNKTFETYNKVMNNTY